MLYSVDKAQLGAEPIKKNKGARAVKPIYKNSLGTGSWAYLEGA